MWDVGTGREGLVGIAKGGGNGWDWNIEDGSVDVQMDGHSGRSIWAYAGGQQIGRDG